MLKAEELRHPMSCLNKAAPDEPIFVLRAKDSLSAQTVRLWATMAEQLHGTAKAKDALVWAQQAEKWRAQNCPEVRDAQKKPEPPRNA